MPVHDWTRVLPGIFHAFHLGWIDRISQSLNQGILPPKYYALPEQVAAGFGLDVLALEMRSEDSGSAGPSADSADSPVALLAVPP
jgi:hypothetical protein